MSKVDSFGQDFIAVNFTAVKFRYKNTTFFSHEGEKNSADSDTAGKNNTSFFIS
jgi:hypothetical protein